MKTDISTARIALIWGTMRTANRSTIERSADPLRPKPGAAPARG
jgi:hypothetical protein